MISNEQEALYALTLLEEELKQLSITRYEQVNIFDAVGMSTQEIKHSAFLAWLLSPSKPHGMKTLFLEDFLYSVINFHKEFEHEKVHQNVEILKNINLFDGFLKADDIVVETEKVIDSPESRIDIFIQSKKTGMTIVIENKVFTSTHDNQLMRYEEETAKFNGNKVYIYLTPTGDIPTDNNGQYQKSWCVLSYEVLLNNIKKRLKKITRTKQNAKLIFLLEDYVKMVDMNILKNNAKVRAKCREITKKYADALELLMNYSDNVDEIYYYVKEWFENNLDNIDKLYYKGRQLCFITKPFVSLFNKYGKTAEITEAWFRFQVGVGSKDGPIIVMMGLGKQTNEEWGEAEIKIAQIMCPNKKMTNKYYTVYGLELVSETERQCSLADLKGQIDERLTTFTNELKLLEQKLIEEMQNT